MVKYKKPLSENPGNCLSQTFKGVKDIDVDELVQHLAVSVPAQVKEDYDFDVEAARETITIGGLLNSKDQPGILFSFPGTQYAQLLVGFNKVGGILDIQGCQYGSVSNNMRHYNAAKQDTGLSLTGLAKKALNNAITDTAAVEEERMHYDALIQTLTEQIENLGA